MDNIHTKKLKSKRQSNKKQKQKQNKQTDKQKYRGHIVRSVKYKIQFVK